MTGVPRFLMAANGRAAPHSALMVNEMFARGWTGGGGGQVVVTGTPEQVSRVEASHTGAFLAEVLGTYAQRRKAG